MERTGGAWITKPFTNWKKAIDKMKTHSQSEIHIRSCAAEADVAAHLIPTDQALQNVSG